MRLQLKPGLRQVWRGRDAVQIGLDPRFGTVIDGLTAADRALLADLTRGIDTEQVTAGRSAGEAIRARTLLQLLRETGVLVQERAGRAALARLGPTREGLAADAAVWSVVHPRAGDGWELLAARGEPTIKILGPGRIGPLLADVLAASGVVQVQVHDTLTPDDVSGGDRLPPDLVVLIDHDAADHLRAQRLLSRDITHLSIVVREASIVVGPLVVPGAGPCLRCLDLHRGERDHAWPAILAQLVPPERRQNGGAETASSGLAAALAALQVLAHLDGHIVPAARGATLEIELPDGLTSRRPWPAHASCGCHWPPNRTGETGGSGVEHGGDVPIHSTTPWP